MIIAIVQARMSSSRLPGKVLMPILGEPMLHRQLERVAQAKLVDKVIVATSVEASDDPIEAFCDTIDQPCFRGDLNNVLNRFYQCTQKYDPDHIIRLTGDCPLVDPDLIDEVIELHLQGNYDYTTNAYPQSYPNGLDVEIMTRETMNKIHQNATTPDELEHVTFYVREHCEDFSIGDLVCPEDLSDQRWTVDYPQDFTLITSIYEELYPESKYFDYHQVMILYQRRPKLFTVNQQQNLHSGFK
jgi:spore coat polysaccharide biosynthesis protein SpsF